MSTFLKPVGPVPSPGVPVGPVPSPGVPGGRVPSPGVPAPTGRKISAQGKAPRAAALGHAPKNTPSPEGAKQSAAQPRIVAELERRLSLREELEPVVFANLHRLSAASALPAQKPVGLAIFVAPES
jgi:hypothetical protein